MGIWLLYCGNMIGISWEYHGNMVGNYITKWEYYLDGHEFGQHLVAALTDPRTCLKRRGFRQGVNIALSSCGPKGCFTSTFNKLCQEPVGGSSTFGAEFLELGVLGKILWAG